MFRREKMLEGGEEKGVEGGGGERKQRRRKKRKKQKKKRGKLKKTICQWETCFASGAFRGSGGEVG